MYQFNNVTHLNDFIKEYINNNKYLRDIRLTAEISQYTLTRKNTAYFTVKDATSVLNCVMFSEGVMLLDFDPQPGDKVTIDGSIGYYREAGKLQFYVNYMVKAGAGDLHEQYKKLFAKLQNEGLFDPSIKKTLPLLPKRIGLITSPTGKVKSDVINTMRQRNPHFDIVLYPASVQGENCPAEVCAGIDYFMEKKDVDVIIIARGGGSYDELFCFNDEMLARKVFACNIPVISAIGHDEDYTILDYVADFRAATPTGAGNCVIGSYTELNNDLNNLLLTLDMTYTQYLKNKRNRLESLKNHKALYSTETYFENQRILVSQLKSSMSDSMIRHVDDGRKDLKSILGQLESLNPSNVLSRGYSYVSDNDGNTIESVDKINKGDRITVVFADGKADATVTDKTKKTEGKQNAC